MDARPTEQNHHRRSPLFDKGACVCKRQLHVRKWMLKEDDIAAERAAATRMTLTLKGVNTTYHFKKIHTVRAFGGKSGNTRRPVLPSPPSSSRSNQRLARSQRNALGEGIVSFFQMLLDYSDDFNRLHKLLARRRDNLILSNEGH